MSPSKANVAVVVLSRVRLFATLWTVAHLAPLSMELSRQEYQSRLPFLTPGDLPSPCVNQCDPLQIQVIQSRALTFHHAGRESNVLPAASEVL